MDQVEQLRYRHFSGLLVTLSVTMIFFTAVNIVIGDFLFLVQNLAALVLVGAGSMLVRSRHLEAAVNSVVLGFLILAYGVILVRLFQSTGSLHFFNLLLLYGIILIVPFIVSYLAWKLYQLVLVGLLNFMVLVVGLQLTYSRHDITIDLLVGAYVLYVFALLVSVPVYLLFNRLKVTVNQNRLAAKEISHKVKNDSFILNGIIEQELAGDLHDETRTILLSLKDRISAFYTIHDFLHKKAHSGNDIDIKSYVENLLANLSVITSTISTRLTVTWDIASCMFTSLNAMALGIIINELVTNSVKHAFLERDEGTIHVSLVPRAEGFRFEYRDNGSGFSSNILDTTSFGMLAVQSQVAVLKGELTVDGSRGFHAVIDLPGAMCS